MPVQRFSQGFKDISLSFKRHPVTNDLLALKNEDAIKRSVQNLIRIQLGEVFFNDFVDPIKTEIETTILNNEPRVSLQSVDVISEPDSNSIDIKISYDLVGLSSPSQTLQFVLEPTRL